MYLVYTLEVQDGQRQRYEYITQDLPKDLTHEEINELGEKILREYYTGDELADGCYWDDYYEIAASYYSYKIIPDQETFRLIQSIIGY